MVDGLEFTKVADCQIICKAFERGAIYSSSEESIFALMTPVLTSTRTQSQGIINQIDNQQALTSLQSTEQKLQQSQTESTGLTSGSSVNLKNLNKSSSKDESIITRVRGDFFPAQGVTPGTNRPINSEIFGNLFNSKCIPCGQRINMAGEVDFRVGVSNYFKLWQEWLKSHLNMLSELVKMFSTNNSYIDLCALIRYLKEFLCVPDLARMLSALMALMSTMNFELNGVFDLILQLAAPLIQPFLSNFVNMLQRYLLLIIGPLECIIESIQRLLAKLDYNVLFQNIDSLDRTASFGRKEGPKKGEIKVLAPILNFVGIDRDLHENPRAITLDYNLLDAATLGTIKQENEKNRKAVQEARDNLRAIQNTRVDGSDSGAIARYNKQIEGARKKYRDAVEKRDLSEVGRLNKKIGDFGNQFRSAMMSLIGALREAATKVEAFFKQVFDELKKLMGEYFGGGNSFIQLLSEKLIITQLASLISQIIKLFAGTLDCDDDNKRLKVEQLIPQRVGTAVWTDQDGNLHIEQDPNIIDRAVNETVKAIGARGSGSLSGLKQEDKGQDALNLTARQKLESLIEFTGDPLLDTSISRITEALTTPSRAVFKCPLQTTLAEADQVNRWIDELSI